jgi:amidohydrolase
MIGALQSITSRSIDPLDAAVVSVTQVHGGDAWNIIPDQVVLRGTVRTFTSSARKTIEMRIRDIAAGVAAAYGCHCDVWYDYRYPATINSEMQTQKAQSAAVITVGEENVIRNPAPSMASEDFAYMLEAKPGAYLWLGSGPGAGLHNSSYDFNDAILGIGASYWVNLVESVLPLGQEKNPSSR